jgi:hypothetical protein
MCWGIAPDVTYDAYSQGMPSSQPVISREVLRAVCEPFFEQMLTALQQTLQATQRQPCDTDMQADARNQTIKPASFQPGLHAHIQQWTYLDPMLDEQSTEDDDVGAFASLLSGPPSESEGIDGIEDQSPEAEFSGRPVGNQALPDDSEQASDCEKSIMVCRHWKTKGWCRLEANCKFLHPEHKRGIAAPKGCTSGSANNGDMSEAACPGMNATSGLPGDALFATTLSRRKRRGGRSKSNKFNQWELSGLNRETTVTMLPQHMGEPSFFLFQCAQVV